LLPFSVFLTKNPNVKTYYLSNDPVNPVLDSMLPAPGMNFRSFASSDEQMLYMADQINKAQRSICDVSWLDQWGLHRELAERKSADRILNESVLTYIRRGHYQEIFVLRRRAKRNRSFRIDVLRERAKDDNNGYYCGFIYSDWERFQFMIIDDEVIFRSSDGESSEIRCAVHQPTFATMWRYYYKRLWRRATILKDEESGADRTRIGRFFEELESAKALPD
jgi:hypothetical protein